MMEERYQRRMLLLLLALVLTIIIIPKGGFVPDYYSPGDIASRDIKAPTDLLVPDLPLTEKKRVEAEDAVLPLYDFDPKTGQDVADRLNAALSAYHTAIQQRVPAETIHSQIETVLGVSLAGGDLKGLRHLVPTPEILGRLHAAVLNVLNHKIVGNLHLFQSDREKGVVLRNLVDQKETTAIDLKNVIGLSDALALLDTRIKEIRGLRTVARTTIFALLQPLTRPNLTFNNNGTEARTRQAGGEAKTFLVHRK